jgi:hypothetical protein
MPHVIVKLYSGRSEKDKTGLAAESMNRFQSGLKTLNRRIGRNGFISRAARPDRRWEIVNDALAEADDLAFWQIAQGHGFSRPACNTRRLRTWSEIGGHSGRCWQGNRRS